MKKQLLMLLSLLMISVVALVGCTSNKSTVEDKRPLGVIGAMEEEVEILKKNMDIKEEKEIAGMTFYVGTLHDKDIVLVRSGVGKVNMAACTQILIDEFNVEALVNSGVSGTLDPELNQGDIIISTNAVQHDFDTTACGGKVGEIERLGITYFDADKELIDIAVKAGESLDNVTIKEGTVASGDVFVAGGEVADKIVENFGNVQAVEMEGASMAHVAYLNKVPYVIIRSVSDKADGGAELSYEEFLPLAAKNASTLIDEFIKLY